MGCWAVHIFFIIFGFLVVKSLSAKENRDNAASDAFHYTLSRFKAIFGPLCVAFSFAFIDIYANKNAQSDNIAILETVLNTLVMLFGIDGDFAPPVVNTTLWYITAFFITLLPVSYMVLKDRKKYLYVIRSGSYRNILLGTKLFIQYV